MCQGNFNDVVHEMGRILKIIFHIPDDFTNSMMYVPDSALVQEEEGESRKNSVSIDAERPAAPTTLSHLSITTKKVTDKNNALFRQSILVLRDHRC